MYDFKMVLGLSDINHKLVPVLHKLLEQKSSIVFLHGELGAGKSELVRRLIQFSGYKGPVSSPSYNILNQYDASLKFVHVDLYRFKRFDAIDLLMLDECYGSHHYLIEWPEHAEAGVLPASDIDIYIRTAERDSLERQYHIKVNGQGYVLVPN